jgi:hypothetical protein
MDQMSIHVTSGNGNNTVVWFSSHMPGSVTLTKTLGGGNVHVSNNTTPRIVNPEYQTIETGANAMELSQNFPNPFSSSTAIKFTLGSTDVISLVVYDLSGREVSRLYEGELSKGNHAFVFNADELPSGTYYYRLMGSNINETRRMILVK